MKETVGTILVFALALAAVLCGLLVLYFFPLYGDFFVPGLGAPAVGIYLRRYIPEVLILTTIICLFLLFGRLKRKPGRPAISYTLILAGSFIIAVAALDFEHIDYAEPENPLLSESMHPLTGGDQLYVHAVDGERIENVVLSGRNTLGARRFQSFDSGEVDMRRRVLEIPERGITVPIEPPNPFFSRMFIQNRSFAWLLGPIGSFLEAATGDSSSGIFTRLSRLRGTEYRYFLIASAFILILTSHWLIRRNDWPLGNAVITVLLFCGFFLLFALMRSQLLNNFLFLVTGRRITERIESFLPLLGMWYFSLVFLLSRGKAYFSSRRIQRSL